jgi:two-component system sensor histidine kinase ChvG
MRWRAWAPGRPTRFLSRIGVRLLAFNILLVFLPVAGLASLDAYEQHLLDQQERAMVQHARLLASALGEMEVLDRQTAQRMLDRLGRSSDARLRLVLPDGRVVADSHRTSVPETPAESYRSPDGESRAPRASPVYRVGAWLGRLWRRVTLPRAARETSSDPIAAQDGTIRAAEVTRALAGSYGSATRLTRGQRSVTLYGALPVTRDGAIVGAVLVSQSTWRILQRLYDVRLRMFEVVIVSLAAAALLGLIASRTIVRPLAHVGEDARAFVDRRGKPTRRFRGTSRRDEIGDLARALEELTNRLDAHLRFTEQFAADVSHEFRNPLASIRASSEMLAEADQPGDRQRFRARIDREIARLEALLARVREITAMDARLDEEPLQTIDLAALVRDWITGRAEVAASRPPVSLEVAGEPLRVRAAPERLVQVVSNLVDNAESFSRGGRVEAELARGHGVAILRVRDEGPGIPAAHLERIFDRFFTHRPDDQAARDTHAGLGLSIAKTIVETYGGTIRAENLATGAQFEVRLPLA